MADEQWYYAQNGQRHGPVSTSALQGMAAAGTLGPQDFVWRDGMADWMPSGSISGLFAAPALVQGAPLGYAGPAPMNYYAPPSQRYPTYAGFWLRFVAAIIDTVICGIVGFVVGLGIGMAVGASMGASGSSMQQIQLMAVLLAQSVGLVLQWLYFALMESSASRGTLGKMALSLAVTDLQGERVSFGKATGRFFGKTIEISPLLIGNVITTLSGDPMSGSLFTMVGFLFMFVTYGMAGWTQRKQALHDLMGGHVGLT